MNPTIVVEYAAKTAALVGAVRDVEKAGKDTGRAVDKVDWGRIAKFAAGATALAAGAVYIKKSADATRDLAKATATLQRATGLDAETASAWVQTLQTRGIEVSTFQTSLVKLSGAMEKARTATAEAQEAIKNLTPQMDALYPVIQKGGKAGKEAEKEFEKLGKELNRAVNKAAEARAPLEALGVSMADIKKGNINAVILDIADAFQEMENPAQKAATAQKLFGRAGQKLVPILSSGSEGIQKQLDLAEKYNATVGQDQVDAVKDITAAQRELQLAQKGVQIQIGSALLPVQVLLYGVLLDITRALAPLTENMVIMTPVVVIATVAWVAYKVAAIAAMIASIGLNASLLITIGIFAAVAIALVAIGVAFVLAYKKIDAFREIVDATWSWIKKNWPLLLAILIGPIAVAALLIYRNFDRIKEGAREAVATIKSVFGTVKDAVVAALNFGQAAWNAIAGIGETIHRFYRTIQGWGNSIGDWIKDAAVNAIVGIGSAIWTKLGEAWNYLRTFVETIKGWGTTLGAGFKAGFVAAISGIGDVVVTAFRAAINTIIRLWNRLQIPSFKVKGPGPLPDIKFPAIKFPDIALLAKGGIVTGPTMAMLGEAGPEMVLPLSGSGKAPVEVRVFIGDTELRGIVRSEVVTENTRTAQTLLAGAV